MRSCSIIAIALVTVIVFPAAAAEITSSWIGGGKSDRWSDPDNWSPRGVPDDTGVDQFHVVIDGDGGQNVEVVLDTLVQIQTLTVDSDDTLRIVSDGTLSMLGGLIHLDGTIVMQPIPGVSFARLFIAQDTLIRGTGLVDMDGPFGQIFVDGPGVLTVGDLGEGELSPALAGSASISVLWLNNARLDATDPTQPFFSTGSSLGNNGTVTSSTGDHLMDNVTLVNTSLGRIEVSDGRSFGMTSSTVSGGTITGGIFKLFPGAGREQHARRPVRA